MARIYLIFPAILAICGSVAATAAADSNIGVAGSLRFPSSYVPAPPMTDPFDEYQMFGRPPFFVGSQLATTVTPWEFDVLGSSSETLVYAFSSFTKKQESITYSGSGHYNLSRADLSGTNAIYQIDFQDDGTKDYGELFYVQDSAEHFIAIGVNNHVANGYYYLRTDQSNGNTGVKIYAPRNGMGGNDNWHSFKLYVTSGGSIGTVDDVVPDMDLYTGLTWVDTVNLKGDWNKPRHTVFIDNLSVTPFTTAAPGTLLSGQRDYYSPGISGPGRIFNPFGDAELTSMSADDIGSLFFRRDTGNGVWLTDANVNRFFNVETAIEEADLQLCDGAATSKYDGGGEWCSEFARWVMMQSGVACETIYDWMSSIESTSEIVSLFSSYNCKQPWGIGYTSRPYITPSTPKPGDYVSLVSGSTGSRNGHSAIVIGISSDARYLWTVEGNINSGPNTPHCVRFGYRDFFVNGVLNPDIDGFGNVDVLIGTPADFCH